MDLIFDPVGQVADQLDPVDVSVIDKGFAFGIHAVKKIEYGAFQNCPEGLQFVCPANSYAASYAQSYGYTVKK